MKHSLIISKNALCRLISESINGNINISMYRNLYKYVLS